MFASEESAVSVYFHQMWKKKLGIPLWRPKPTRVLKVELGDVGFYDRQHGYFLQLFNATKSENHPLNALGVPEGFVTLPFDNHPASGQVVFDSEALPPQVLHSSSTLR